MLEEQQQPKKHEVVINIWRGPLYLHMYRPFCRTCIVTSQCLPDINNNKKEGATEN